MTPKEAIEILMSDEKLAEIEYYGGFEGQKKVAKLYSEAFDMAIKALEKQAEYRNRIKDLITIIENICKNSRDRHSDDEHCGLCEYDGAYIGESGDWCNECPGFEKDDCFVLSNRFKRKYVDWRVEE